MYQRHQDTLLLEEAYKATQLKQHLPNLTMQQIHLVIENGSPAELEILDEGLRSMLGGARSSLAGIGGVLKGGKDALQKAGDTVKAGWEGTKAIGKTVAGNVKDKYSTAKQSFEAKQRKEQLINHLAQVKDLYNAHKEVTKDGRLKAPFERLTFQQLQQRLSATESVKKRAAAQARSQGFFKGAGKAAGIAGQKAFEKSKQDRAAREGASGGAPGGAPGAAPAPA